MRNQGLSKKTAEGAPELRRRTESSRSDASLLDYDSLKDEFGEQTALNLLALFKTSADGIKERIRSSIQEQDTEKALNSFHELKGSASSLRAGKLSALAVRLEELATQSDWQGITELEPVLLKSFDLTIKQIDAVTASRTGTV